MTWTVWLFLESAFFSVRFFMRVGGGADNTILVEFSLCDISGKRRKKIIYRGSVNTWDQYHHHHQVPDLEQTLAAMPLQTSLSSDNLKKFKPLLCPPVAELQRLSRNVILCLPLSRLPSTFPVKDKNSKPLRLHTCPKSSICLFLIVFNSDLWTFPSLNTLTLGFFSVHEILNIRLINHISAASIFFSGISIQ